jgi:hypothetical protein
MRFASTVELQSSSGQHLRWLPAARAAELVISGQAAIANGNGRAKAIRLISGPGPLIGQPTGTWYAPPFSVPEKLDSGHVVWRHHARSTYERPE